MDNGYYRNSRVEIFDLLLNYDNLIVSRHRKVLEIGCGECNFSLHFKNVEYWAVEPSALHARKAEEKGIKILVGTYENVCGDIPNGYFDLVVINDVMEHTIDHERFLSLVKCKLKEDGLLLGSVPNIRFITVLLNLIILRDWRYKSFGVLDYTHLRFFTRRSLVRALQESNFVVKKMIGINKIVISSSFRDWLLIMCSWILGSDTRFMQYGFIALNSPLSNPHECR